MGVQRLEPTCGDALAIGQEHEDVGRAAAAGELDRQGAQIRSFQLEVSEDVDAGEFREIRQKRSDRIRPGMDRARERDRVPRKLFPIDRSVGIDRAGVLGEAPPR
jgi:hypothetical protein